MGAPALKLKLKLSSSHHKKCKIKGRSLAVVIACSSIGLLAWMASRSMILLANIHDTNNELQPGWEKGTLTWNEKTISSRNIATSRKHAAFAKPRVQPASATTADATVREKPISATRQTTKIIYETIELDEHAEQFLASIEQVDGLSPSLRVLLQAALTMNRGVDDLNINPTLEAERCERYGYTLDATKPLRRRRVFWGSLLADDSWHVLGLAAMESHGILHTAAFIESNTTQSLQNRTLRFPNKSVRKQLLQSPLLWGNTTQVHVDYYLEDADPFYLKRSLWRENHQRDFILKRWKESGMKHDDIGYMSDVDEFVSRDFLRALQICDIRAFRSPHDCYHEAKITSGTVVFEGSPHCLQIPRKWNHPNVIIGECVDQIGDLAKHPPVPRVQKSGANMRVDGWHTLNTTLTIGGPLWDANDFRMERRGSLRSAVGSTPTFPKRLRTGFHFHNFFDSIDVLRRKYKTYGHPDKRAYEVPLSELQPNDLGFMVDCLTGRRDSGSKWRQPTKGSVWDTLDPTYGLPIAFSRAPHYAELRHHEFQEQLALDETLHPPTISTVQ